MKKYSENLKDPRWQKKRLEIMQRDNFTCQCCGDNTTELHVHHKTYSNGKEPWDYSNDNFETLCINCHNRNHHKIEITENGGAINPSEVIMKFGKFSSCISQIGNHKGQWTIKLIYPNYNRKCLGFLSLLSGFAFFDNDDFIIDDGNGYMVSMDILKAKWHKYSEFRDIGLKLNPRAAYNNEYDESISIECLYKYIENVDFDFPNEMAVSDLILYF